MASNASKTITQATLGNTLDNQEGVVQVFFRIPPALSVRIATAAAERRVPRRLLWIAAMESYLGQATELKAVR